MRLSHPTSRPVYVDLTTEDDRAPGAHQATAGTCVASRTDDYEAATDAALGNPPPLFNVDLNTGATAEPSPGADSLERNVEVDSCDDTVFEFDETFLARIDPDEATGALVTLDGDDAVATGTILNNDGPSITVAGAEVSEDDSAGEMVFTVTLNGATDLPIIVDLWTTTSTGPHQALADIDYTPIDENSPARITFPVSSDSTQSDEVAVQIINEDWHEFDETFLARIRSDEATGAPGAPVTLDDDDAVATGTIRNDDPPPVISIVGASAVEGSPVTFPVLLRPAAGRDVTVGFTTVDYQSLTEDALTHAARGGTDCDTPRVDYLHNDDDLPTGGGRLIFKVDPATGRTDNAYHGRINQNIDVTTCVDNIFEHLELFGIELVDADTEIDDPAEIDQRAVLSETNAAAQGTILGDCFDLEDTTRDPPTILLSGRPLGFEGEDFEIGVSLATSVAYSARLCKDGYLLWSNSDGSAVGTSATADPLGDYERVDTDTVTFPASKIFTEITQTIFDDNIDEERETFTVTVNWRVGAGYMPSHYSGQSDQEIEISIQDNDTAAISIEPASGDQAASAVEGEMLVFEVSSDIPTARDIEVTYRTLERVTGPIDERAMGGTCVPTVTGDYEEVLEVPVAMVTIVADATPGATPTARIEVDACEDEEDDEGEETFLVELSTAAYNPTGFFRPWLKPDLDGRSATGKILEPCRDDLPDGNWLHFGHRVVEDGDVSFRFDNIVDEGDTPMIPVTIEQSFCDDQVFVVSARERDPTVVSPTVFACSGSYCTGDFEEFSQDVTIPAGETSVDVPVIIYDDEINEDTESFFIYAQWQPPEGTPASTVVLETGIIFIEDNDDVTVGLTGGSALEGENVVFTISLDRASWQDVELLVSTRDDEPVSASRRGDDGLGDYLGVSRRLVPIPAGELSAEVLVKTLRDNVGAEGDETFRLQLGAISTPYTPDITRPDPDYAVGTIIDESCIQVTGEAADPDPPEITLTFLDGVIDDEDNPRIPENRSDLRYRVTLSPPFCEDEELSVSLGAGTALPGYDYVDNPPSVSFGPRQVESSGRVGILNDRLDELDETFTIEFRWPDGMGAAYGEVELDVPVVIVDDDTAVISVEGASGDEGDTLGFTVSSDIPTARDIEVTYSTLERVTSPIDERAIGGECAPKVTGDYEEATGAMVTIVADATPGATPTATIGVLACTDDDDEGPETFLVQLSDAVYDPADPADPADPGQAEPGPHERPRHHRASVLRPRRHGRGSADDHPGARAHQRRRGRAHW